MKKTLKRLFLGSLILLVLGVGFWLAVKHIAVFKAGQKAGAILMEAYNPPPDSPDEKVIAITRQIFERFEHAEPAHVPLLRIRPYVTNERLPSFLRLPGGVIETQLEKGLCDNAVRMTSFLLKQEGFESVQWNMVTPENGHSALLVTMPDGRKVLADPFLGYVAKGRDGRLIHPRKAQELVKAGTPFEDVFTALGEKSDPRFYERLDRMSMAAQGDDLTLEATLPRVGKEPLFLGEINGKAKDVMASAKKYGMSPYWQYMGHKYNREWVRVLKTEQPVRLVMTLVLPAESGILTATPAPSVQGKTLSWELDAGDTITFRDGLAEISLKRMNSYIGVDRIAVYPVTAAR